MPQSSSPKSRSPRSPRSPSSAGAATNEPTIEVDETIEEEDENDPTLGSDAASSTASITSSILHYRTINGRTYHSERGNAAYWGSNDEPQSEAMDIAHHMWTLALDGELHQAPLKDDIQKALDIGCGTGIWAIDFADKFPGCEVIGTDVSPIQPPWVPPNLKFEIEDCNQEWTFSPESFDYIHIRYLIGCIPDWTELFKQAYKALKPGGIIESFEVSPTIESDDDTVTPDSAMAKWGTIFIQASEKIGNVFTVIADDIQGPSMQKAGFTDIHEWNGKCPLNPWPKDPKLKEIGQFGELFSTQDTEGFVLFVANTLGWSPEEVHVYIAHFRREIRNRKFHPYIRMRNVWARKPLTEEETVTAPATTQA
ncbi:demethylmenaquinone methyltransferase [Fusarium albosuccineum]|uniref:Demethylmenaquinone methyltransferase n=1 Tax=Fusarium albosuccineum TaxID=1237068 RepID=A0A8H4P901_9HYPO|nr:demethylmenaquinone methyltransferase [Fusarium albosuccineum]